MLTPFSFSCPIQLGRFFNRPTPSFLRQTSTPSEHNFKNFEIFQICPAPSLSIVPIFGFEQNCPLAQRSSQQEMYRVCFVFSSTDRGTVVRKTHIHYKNDNERRRSINEMAGCDDDAAEDGDDDELGFFGIVVQRQATPSCPYSKDGQYIPRNQRR